MKVLVVSQYFWPESFRINEVVRTLVEKGIEVDVLTGKPNYPDGIFFPGHRALGCQVDKIFGARVYRLPMIARGKHSALRLVLNYLSFVISGLLIAPWLLRKTRYDAILVYAPSPILQAIPALFVGWLKRSKVVVWVQDLWPESLEATGYVRSIRVLRGVEKLVRFIYRHTDLLLVQSKGFLPRVRSLASGQPVVYYPNSVDAVFCDPPDMQLPEIAVMDGCFSVVFAGNVGAVQAVEVIVAAASLLQSHADIRFVVFGQGSRLDWMREEVLQLGLTNLQLMGRYPVETMPGLMQKASVLLVTLADQPIFSDTVPNKVQAYLAAGRPIVACLNGEGARLVVEARAGLAVPAEDVRGLANAILQLHGMSAEERAAMGASGRSYFKEHFDHDKLTDDLIRHLRVLAPVGRSDA